MRLILSIVLILIMTLTIGICVKQPQMHKSVMVYNSEYKLVNNDDVDIQQPASIPIKTNTETLPQKTVTTVQTNIIPKTVTVTQPKTTTQKSTETKKSDIIVKSTTAPVSTTTVNTVPKVVERVANQHTKTEPAVKQEQTKKQTVTLPRIMTQQEELIAWNIWRSNLQNKIMQDVKMPIVPNGTIFKFTFSVDKYGKISNVQTWSTTPQYTPYAIQYIAPVIRSYQGRSILSFPSCFIFSTAFFTLKHYSSFSNIISENYRITFSISL